jgi:hypothetical protein
VSIGATAMQLQTSFFGTAGEMAFSGYVYRFQPTLFRAQIRIVPKDAPMAQTMAIPGAKRSPRHVVEGANLEEVLTRSKALIEQQVGPISEFLQQAPKI